MAEQSEYSTAGEPDGGGTGIYRSDAAQQQQQQQQLSPLQKKSTFINLPADICAHNFRDPAIKEPLSSVLYLPPLDLLPLRSFSLAPRPCRPPSTPERSPEMGTIPPPPRSPVLPLSSAPVGSPFPSTPSLTLRSYNYNLLLFPFVFRCHPSERLRQGHNASKYRGQPASLRLSRSLCASNSLRGYILISSTGALRLPLGVSLSS